jgi:hypothetical protein
MAITSSQTNGMEITRMASGAHLDDAASPAAISLTLGFTPRYVKMVNSTTIQVQEWFEGLGAADAIKTVNHASTQLSKILTGGITVDGGTVTLPAPAQNDQIYWVALG